MVEHMSACKPCQEVRVRRQLSPRPRNDRRSGLARRGRRRGRSDGPLRRVSRRGKDHRPRRHEDVGPSCARGLQIDLRVVPAESFGAALQYFTGSKEHNVMLRGRAKQQGLKINEYGVYRVKGDKETYVAGETEEDVYATLDLPAVPAGNARGPAGVRLGGRRRVAGVDRPRRHPRRSAHAHHGDRRQGDAGGNGRRRPRTRT